MNEDKKYIKLRELVGRAFRVEKVWGYTFLKWDDANNKMLRSDTWQKDYQKKWQVVTNHGQVDVSDYQFSSMLAAVYDSKSDSANLVGKAFHVKSNNKSGKEIRYYINLVREDTTSNVGDEEEPVTMQDIPF